MSVDKDAWPRGVYRGRVTSLTVKGIDANSAEIQVSVEGKCVEGPIKGASAAFRAAAQPVNGIGHEPQVFAAYATVLASALDRQVKVSVSYRVRDGATPEIYALEVAS